MSVANRFHFFSRNGRDLALDTATGALFRVNAAGRSALEAYGESQGRSLRSRLRDRIGEAADDAAGELASLTETGLLVPDPGSEPPGGDLRGLRALCLHVAHACNLTCSYCFAAEGVYGGPRELMSPATARRAVEFLFESAAPDARLEIDLFGGEPLLNMNAVRAVVERGRELARERNRLVRFTVTTNGLLLTGEIADYVRRHMDNVVISIDGRPEVHDRVRRLPDGTGSQATVLNRAQRFIDEYRPASYWVRGTFTRANLDFTRDVSYLADAGFDCISIEPVIGGVDDGYGLGDDDLPRVEDEYGVLAEYLLDRARRLHPVRFFHFELAGASCRERRVLGCGAGSDYLAVTPSGELYPCHQFVSHPDFRLGSVREGLSNSELHERFWRLDLSARRGCSDCWARLLCGGGCHALSWNRHRDLHLPDEAACRLHRCRLEWACYLKSECETGTQVL